MQIDSYSTAATVEGVCPSANLIWWVITAPRNNGTNTNPVRVARAGRIRRHLSGTGRLSLTRRRASRTHLCPHLPAVRTHSSQASRQPMANQTAINTSANMTRADATTATNHAAAPHRAKSTAAYNRRLAGFTFLASGHRHSSSPASRTGAIRYSHSLGCMELAAIC